MTYISRLGDFIQLDSYRTVTFRTIERPENVPGTYILGSFLIVRHAYCERGSTLIQCSESIYFVGGGMRLPACSWTPCILDPHYYIKEVKYFIS